MTDSEAGRRPEMPRVSKGTRPRPVGLTVTDPGHPKYGPEEVRRAIARQVAAKVRCVSQLYRNVTADQQADAVCHGFTSVMDYWWDRYSGRFEPGLEFDLAVKHGRETAVHWLRKEVRRQRHETHCLEALLHLAAPDDVETTGMGNAVFERVRGFVEGLDKKARLVIEGRYYYDQTWNDVAALAECNVRTAHRLHKTALVQLRDRLRSIGMLSF